MLTRFVEFVPFLRETVAQQLPVAQELSEAQVLVMVELPCSTRSTSRKLADVDTARSSIARVTLEIIQKKLFI